MILYLDIIGIQEDLLNQDRNLPSCIVTKFIEEFIVCGLN
jgi:hypothetical protein